MKRKVIVSVLLVLVMTLVLASCNKIGTQNEDVSKITYYFETKDGRLNADKWIAFVGNEWNYFDGQKGTTEQNGNAIILKKEEGVWATGRFSDGNFVLSKNGRAITYYALGNELPEKQVFTMKNVYEKAKDLGFEGTLDELIEMFRGPSAYELAVKSGYRGTEAQWIASLAGSDGRTPSIGKNGHWYVGEVDTGVAAAGAGITKIEKTATEENVDTYTIFISDGRTYDFAVTNGLDGEAAEKGTGIEKIEKTATNGNVDTYTVTLTDGTFYTYDVTNGRDGKDGKDGRDGHDGADAPALTVEELYEAAVQAGYTGTYLEFIAEYLPTGSDAETAEINASCFSVVSIVCPYYFVQYGTAHYGASAASGIIYQINKEAGDAYIMTNYHVVYASERTDEQGKADPGICDKIYVYLFGSEIIGNEISDKAGYQGMYIEAEYIGGSLTYDLALLKITDSDRIRNSNAIAATLIDSETVSQNDTVYAVGNSGGDGIAVTKGIVNYLNEPFTTYGADGETIVSFRVMRCDAVINPGNSGGALFNSRGEMVGLVNGKMINSSYDSVGYAIPSNVAKNVADNILYYYEKTGEAPVSVKKVLFGVTYSTSEAHAEYDVNTGKIVRYENFCVMEVGETSLVAGQLEKGDIITKMTIVRDGVYTEHVLYRPYILTDLTFTVRAGDRVILTYIRDVDGTETEGEAVVDITDNNLTVAE